MKSTYSISSSTGELKTDSEAIFSQGFDMIDTKFNDGVWLTAYGKNIGKADTFVNNTAWNSEPTLRGFQERIAERREDGYELTDVEYTDGTDDIITPSDREAIADPVQNTLRTITQQTLLNSVFD